MNATILLSYSSSDFKPGRGSLPGNDSACKNIRSLLYCLMSRSTVLKIPLESIGFRSKIRIARDCSF